MFAKLCLFTLTLAYVCAASGSATINGTVSDESGAPITGALVNLHETFGFVLLANTSDSAGHFTFSGVTAGQYLLDASAPGLSVAQPQTLNIEAGAVVQVAVELVVSATKSQVSVTAADSPQSVDQVSKALDIVNVPDAERRGLLSVVDAVRFVPGMRVSTRGSIGEFSTIQARGLRTTDTDILVDGFPFRDVTSIQDEASAFVGDLLLVDSSQIEVLRGSGSSLYGTNSTAGTVNILTDPGGGPAHGNIDLQGGGLGLFRGLANVAGGAGQNRLTYSAGFTHLNVSKGADNVEATRDWSGQGAVSFALAPNMRFGVDVFAATGYLEDPVSPASTPGVSAAGIIPAIPLPMSQVRLLDLNLPYNPGNSTFWPELGDPDSGIYSHFVFALFRFEHEVTSRLSYRIGYEITDTQRNNTNGPAGPNTLDNFEPTYNTSERYHGRLQTVRAQLDYRLGEHQLLTGGYEFEQEHYRNVNADQNPDPTARLYNSTVDTQRSHAAFAQDQIRLLEGRLELLFSGRFTALRLDQPVFVGGTSPYTGLPLPKPPAAYTGDVSLAYFIPSTSTKLRAHAGNSFRMPSIYERFGGYFFGGFYIPIGNPNLAPERTISVDFGLDQYLFQNRLKISSTYFYSHLQRIIDYLDFPPGYVDPYGRTSGYYNRSGGIARGVELSGEFHPARSTSIFASYTYTNAKDRISQYYTGTSVDPLQTPRILPDTVTVVATQQFGKRVDFGMDFEGGSSYLYPLYGLQPGSFLAFPYAYRFSGPRQLGLDAGYTLTRGEHVSTRLYVRVSNALDQNFYEDAFHTPNRWAVAGVHFAF